MLMFSLDMKCTDLCIYKSCSNVYADEDVETTEEDEDYENFDNDDWDDMMMRNTFWIMTISD